MTALRLADHYAQLESEVVQAKRQASQSNSQLEAEVRRNASIRFLSLGHTRAPVLLFRGCSANV
jgi:hypothetical protein